MTTPADREALARVLQLVADALDGLRYGELVIRVHGGQVVQIDRTVKLRPSPPPPLDPKH
ncbi:MAG TPA: YezD family protein [Kofleriaceae bacterium]|nr:YezD family protein [Kofleriaceae bacterium]